MLATQFLLLHEGKIDPRKITGCTTILRSDKGVVKASGSATNVQDWVDQSRVAYTFEQAVYGNLCVNPGFESALGAEWAEAINATGTSAQSADYAKYGTKSLKVAMTDGVGAGRVIRRAQNIAAVAGDVWSVGVQIYVLALTGAKVRTTVQFLDAALATVGTPTVTDILTAGSGFVLQSTLNKTAPATTAWINIQIGLISVADDDTGTVYFDGVQAVKAASLPIVYSQGNSIKNSFDQRTTASQPVVTPAVFKGKLGVTFDGADDLMRSILGPYLAASSGAMMALVKLTGTTSQTQVILASSDEGSATSFLSLRARRSNATPFINVIQQDAAGATDDIHGDTTIAATPLYVTVIRSDGSAYTERVNGRVEVLTDAAGANTGDWAGDTTLRDNTTIGAKKDSTGTVSPVQGYLICLLLWEVDPGFGARMRQLERMLRHRGLRCLR